MQEHNSKEALIANLKMHSKTQLGSCEEPGTNLVCFFYHNSSDSYSCQISLNL